MFPSVTDSINLISRPSNSPSSMNLTRNAVLAWSTRPSRKSCGDWEKAPFKLVVAVLPSQGHSLGQLRVTFSPACNNGPVCFKKPLRNKKLTCFCLFFGRFHLGEWGRSLQSFVVFFLLLHGFDLLRWLQCRCWVSCFFTVGINNKL